MSELHPTALALTEAKRALAQARFARDEAMRAMRAREVPLRTIAREFGTSHQRVAQILASET